jgi:hypothetical protein
VNRSSALHLPVLTEENTHMIKTKFLLLAGVLAIAGLSVANAKSYQFTISAPTKVGQTQLNQGFTRLR